ncbi:unnamed protein product [Amoebophrya sp. A120]|nr:unnamed protein product [Amoebophrya sp. A120]|eukprot:GSA120T00022276001.1
MRFSVVFSPKMLDLSLHEERTVIVASGFRGCVFGQCVYFLGFCNTYFLTVSFHYTITVPSCH